MCENQKFTHSMDAIQSILRPIEAELAIFRKMQDDLAVNPNPLLRMTTPGLDADRKGCLITDEVGKTTREGVYAGGDAVTGAATVILAMGAGKQAAAAIDEYLKNK